jgi:hypothetical protein
MGVFLPVSELIVVVLVVQMEFMYHGVFFEHAKGAVHRG